MNANKKLITEVLLFATSQIILVYGIRTLMSHLSPTRKKITKNRKKLEELFKLKKINHNDLDDYEKTIATEIILPEEIDIKFADVGGLQGIIEDLKESIIYPVKYKELYQKNKIQGVSKGVLLYGPPGCGKTMLAKAIAKEAGLTFINMRCSALTDKYYGESNKLISALFSLARKLAPSIIFIDEIDSFLRNRQSSDHEATTMIKAEFMTLWDGLMNTENNEVVIMGATNRIDDIDPAFMRRLTKKININLPDKEQRTKILRIMMDTQLSMKCALSAGEIEDLARITSGFTGSDLKELCREAALIPIREHIRKLDGNNETEATNTKCRDIYYGDFVNSIHKVRADVVFEPLFEHNSPLD